MRGGEPRTVENMATFLQNVLEKRHDDPSVKAGIRFRVTVRVRVSGRVILSSGPSTGLRSAPQPALAGGW